MENKTPASNLTTITMQELYEQIYRNRPPVIDGLLYPGTYIFAGAPKVGKSFFMAQLAYHVSTGQKLWEYEVHQGTVLYLALEDNYQRLQKRMFRMFGVESTENLHFAVCAGQLNNGLDEQLGHFIKAHSNTRLIIIDTLQKIRELGGEAYNYAEDYQIIDRLKEFADQNELCLIIVHHTRKAPAGDKFEMISGTTGLLGCADGAFILQKEKRTNNTAILDIVGRDQPDQKIHLVRNEETLAWDFASAEKELWQEPPDPLLESVAKLLINDKPKWSGTATQLITALGLDIKPNALAMRLNVRASKLANDYSISYESSRSHTGRMITLALIEPH